MKILIKKNRDCMSNNKIMFKTYDTLPTFSMN